MTAPHSFPRRPVLRHAMVTALLLLSIGRSPNSSFAAPGVWIALPPPPTKQHPYTSDFSIDPDGFPILMAGQEVWRREGEKWVAVTDGERSFTSGVYLSGLYGGPDRGLWMTQSADRGQEGPLYRIREGRPARSGSYRFWRQTDEPGIFVSRAGDLFNYTVDSLAVRRGEEWATVETPLGHKPWEVSVADFSPGGPVVFLSRASGDAAFWDGVTLHPKVAVEGVPPDAPGDSMPLSAVPWGKNRLLLWRYCRLALAAVELREGRFAAVDSAPLIRELGAETKICDGWGAPDGSAWLLISRPGGLAYALARISPEGEVLIVPEEETIRLGWDNQRFSQFPESARGLPDGTLWLGLERGGIARVSGGRVEVFSWDRGVASDGINWVVPGPGGRIFAAGRDGWVYVWDPAGPAPVAAAPGWEEVVDLRENGPLQSPDGSLWVFRADRPGTVSRWDGAAWRDFAVPFGGRDVQSALADDQGCLLTETRGGSFLVCPDGVRRGREASVQGRVSAGVRRFTQREMFSLGPVVDARGRVWSGHREYTVRVESEGSVKEFRLRGVRHIGLAEDGVTPWFATPEGWWIHRDGQPAQAAGRESGENRRVLAGPGPDLLPWADSLPSTLRAGLVPLIRSRRAAWVPVEWEEAERFEADEADDRRLEQRAAVQYPEGVLCRDSDGLWIADDNGPPVRIWRGRHVTADGAGTPFAGRRWYAAGFDPAGHLWIDTGRYGEGWHLFILKGSGLPVSLGTAEVVRGRTITATVAERAGRFTEHRLDDGPWREAPEDALAFTVHCASPGKREVALEVRLLDSVGLPRPSITRSFSVDVRLPVLGWAGGAPPVTLKDPLWTPPLAVDWPYPEVKHAIEYRVDGGEWRALDRDGSVPAFRWAGRTVTLEFRAVEEGVFASVQAISAEVRVDVDLKDWARKLVQEAGEPTGRGASKATRYLAMIPEEAIPALQEEIAKGGRAAPLMQQMLWTLEHR